MAENLLSIFIDESGDFGSFRQHSPYYFVSLVFHAQKTNISLELTNFEHYISSLGYKKHALHTGPLIRREAIYIHDDRIDRQHLFNALFNFTRNVSISYWTAKVNKRECPDEVVMTSKLSKALADFLREHEIYLRSFDKVIVYYDNGQIELTKILTSVFTTLFTNVEFHKSEPVKYTLAQVADLICTMELLAQKAELKCFSKSELDFFGSIRDFKRNYLKQLRKKRL